MANQKQRYINTKFWNDNYVSELDPIEKLLFIYLLTNGHTNISGIYEVPIKVIAIETGIEVSMLNKILPRLEEKVRYIDGYVVIRKFLKHQQTQSSLVSKGIMNCLDELDRSFLIHLVNKGFYEVTEDIANTLSIGYTYPLNYSNSNLDSNSNSKDTSASADSSFDKFWEQYPKKELKKKTKEIWKRKKLHVHLKEIMTFIEKAKKTDRWQKGYIKQPPAFLNGECWNDDLTSYGSTSTAYQNQNEDQEEKYKKLSSKVIKNEI